MITLRREITNSFIAFALAACTAMGQTAPSQDLKVQDVPADIEVEEGNSPYLSLLGVGTQNYICLPSASGFSWRFFSPQATLFTTLKSFGSDGRQQITTHFLSPNPGEDGNPPRVTWQHSFDTSAVWGQAVGFATVDKNAIQWLKVKRVGSLAGPTGGDTLSQATVIQRLNTVGGLAPSTGCSQTTDVGKSALVPYSADYVFYKPTREKEK
jgi:hypothetical protein